MQTDIKRVLGKLLASYKKENDEHIIYVKPENILESLKKLKIEMQFKQLIYLCGADYPQKAKRFEVIYCLLSHSNNNRIIVKTQLEDGQEIMSVTSIFAVANWYEREAWDMYGIKFAEHDDLRRILTDYGFEGHPLRKDFPLTGHLEVRYDLEQKKVIYEPVTLTQEYRDYDFMSPWEGAEYVLPGDEKAPAANTAKANKGGKK